MANNWRWNILHNTHIIQSAGEPEEEVAYFDVSLSSQDSQAFNCPFESEDVRIQ